MNWPRKRKYVEHDGRLWDDDWQEVTIKTTIVNTFWTPNHHRLFMKTFLSWLQIDIFNRIGEDYKYFGVLQECTDFDNCINFDRFRDVVKVTDATFYNLRKRLVENYIVGKIWREWFFNPALFMRGKKYKNEVWDYFKWHTEKLYWIMDI